MSSRVGATAEPAADTAPDGEGAGSSRCVRATRVARTAKTPPESSQKNDSFKPVIVNEEAGLRLLDLLERLAEQRGASENDVPPTLPKPGDAA